MPAPSNHYDHVTATAAAQAMSMARNPVWVDSTSVDAEDSFGAGKRIAAIQIVNDTVFTNIEWDYRGVKTVDTSMAGITHPAGMYIPGIANSLSVASGVVIVYST